MAANQLEDVVQRWRTTEVFKPEDHKLFLNAGHTCIAQDDCTQLLDFKKEEANQHIVRSMGSGLLPALVNEVWRKDRSPANSQAILNQLVQVRLIQMPSQDSIIVLMPLIQSVLLRISESKARGLALALDSLQKQISKLPVPYSHKQEQEDVYGLCRIKNQDTNSVATKLRAALLKLYVFKPVLIYLFVWCFYNTHCFKLIIPRILIIGASLVKTKFFSFLRTVPIYKTTFVIYSQNLITIMIDCPIQHLVKRKKSWFQLFIEKLNGEVKHTFFRRIMKTSHHAGVESIIIKIIKNQVERYRKSAYEDSWFEETPLISLLRDTIILPQGHETDLLHGMDRVMEYLNLLRYLLIQERHNSTGIWIDLCHIADSYTKLLRLCLSLSKSYYRTELKRLREDKKIKAKGNTYFEEMLGNMPCEAQDKVLQCALVTYDLMESLVVRIEEIIEDSQN
uniref:Glomulin, FKBP associated protein b n=1 Tax=Sinocyclocheilus grahami TaxID=75366 RepID=A0A672N331_SINGR